MNQQKLGVAAGLLGLCVLAGAATSQKSSKAKPHRSVAYATSWENAVREAKLLHLPIVVHNHGFY